MNSTFKKYPSYVEISNLDRETLKNYIEIINLHTSLITQEELDVDRRALYLWFLLGDLLSALPENPKSTVLDIKILSVTKIRLGNINLEEITGCIEVMEEIKLQILPELGDEASQLIKWLKQLLLATTAGDQNECI
ncbi:MAG: hypothetical protein ABL903_07465 [Methylococcales bacterium]